ncbi:undecaprenyl-phosphate glucose phosphotransferase [Paenibacillus hemerocallicola]|uniref:Undecaprenyl-phosphate glucose phosphotransferase n=1 Tax=Paenibacillus hemerocallicola TaxID=1172614 RepID=A0A5C4SVG2_9BACL|nr:undecaprenyl-phosphate glucose phosphotransferase [Paenibacillus hemerocallicola]TNJ55276.1 undecaprenyl-phosphate glucose phosphotransferase [Paenibacillus hemerocallicola]
MVRRGQRFLSQFYALVDFIVIQFSFLISWWLKFKSGLLSFHGALPFSSYFQWSAIYGVVAIGTGYFVLFYSSKRRRRFSFEVFKIVQVHLIAIFILLGILFIVKEVHVSRAFLVLLVASSVVFLTIYRYMIKTGLKYFREKGYNKLFVLIIGAGSLGRRFYENLYLHPEHGYEVVGFLDDYQTSHESEYMRYKPILGTTAELEQVLRDVLIDEVIIALPLDAHHKYGNIISNCEKAGVKIMIIPDYFDYLPARPYFDNFAGIPLINVRDIPLDDFRNRVAKRAFDIIFAFLALLFTSPLLVIIFIAIKLTSPGPVLFKQERVGLNRRRFMMYKFRTMEVMPQVSSDTEWTQPNDPRRTRLGKFLRKTSLDELPQFFNVLMGHMSVVGPRPERPHFVEQFKEGVPKYMIKHHIRPGITGWAQASGLRGDTSIEERIKHDIFYIENWTFLFDIKIILKTIFNGFVNKNAY